MDKVIKVWFDNHRIYIETDSGELLSRPLEAFPRLLDASPAEREAFTIGRFGDDIHWEALDEDIHISSFHETTEPNPDNEVGSLFREFPQLRPSEMASLIGIQKSLLDKYIYGMKLPSAERMAQIKAAMLTASQRPVAV